MSFLLLRLVNNKVKTFQSAIQFQFGPGNILDRIRRNEVQVLMIFNIVSILLLVCRGETQIAL